MKKRSHIRQRKMSRELLVIRADAGVDVLETKTRDLLSRLIMFSPASACCPPPSPWTRWRFLCCCEHVWAENLLLCVVYCMCDRQRTSRPHCVDIRRSLNLKTDLLYLTSRQIHKNVNTRLLLWRGTGTAEGFSPGPGVSAGPLLLPQLADRKCGSFSLHGSGGPRGTSPAGSWWCGLPWGHPADGTNTREGEERRKRKSRSGWGWGTEEVTKGWYNMQVRIVHSILCGGTKNVWVMRLIILKKAKFNIFETKTEVWKGIFTAIILTCKNRECKRVF